MRSSYDILLYTGLNHALRRAASEFAHIMHEAGVAEPVVVKVFADMTDRQVDYDMLRDEFLWAEAAGYKLVPGLQLVRDVFVDSLPVECYWQFLIVERWQWMRAAFPTWDGCVHWDCEPYNAVDPFFTAHESYQMFKQVRGSKSYMTAADACRLPWHRGAVRGLKSPRYRQCSQGGQHGIPEMIERTRKAVWHPWYAPTCRPMIWPGHEVFRKEAMPTDSHRVNSIDDLKLDVLAERWARMRAPIKRRPWSPRAIVTPLGLNCTSLPEWEAVAPLLMATLGVENERAIDCVA